MKDKEPWFVAKDVANALNITWSGHTLDQIPDAWKGSVKFTTPGGEQTMTVISEAGLYKLAFRCQSSDAADKFTNVVAGEILPQIRKTGAYKVKRRWRQRPLLVSDPPEKRKSDYPIDRGGLWELFYRELQTYTTFSDIYDACVHTKKKRAYVLEVLRGRKMSWPVLGFLTDRANVNKVHGIEGHLPISITKPDSMREQKTTLMEKLICTRTPQELEEERQKPINEQFQISYPFL